MLSESLKDALEEGQIVQLGDLGSFRVGIRRCESFIDNRSEDHFYAWSRVKKILQLFPENTGDK
ncbi:MAG: hypothetical protein PF541_03765 [Prolixibacteraceae bacterium]|nr:hypothetical protein [Prolixibacteraceae bacterium]